MTKREHIRALCEARGIGIHRREGGAMRLYGPGVDILTTDLASVSPADLAPTSHAGGPRTLRQREADDVEQAGKAASLLTRHPNQSRAARNGAQSTGVVFG